MGLRLLTPVIRPEKTVLEAPATPNECAEYAILLQRSGSVGEALSILKNIPGKEIPSALLYQAFCHFNLWDYEKALSILEHYITFPLEPYQALIARVNLGAAYVATDRFTQAEEQLLECIETASLEANHRLVGNCRELLSQVYLLRDQLDLAKENLDQASQIFDSPKSLDRLLVEKCRAFLLAKGTGSVEPLQLFRSTAQTWGHAETVRETDLFMQMIKFDEPTFKHLFFGTPFLPYRERIERYVGRVPSDEHFILGDPKSRCLDVASANLEGASPLKVGSTTHRVLEALLRDFYKTVSVSALFAILYPEENFNIFTSPTRVHQALRRARRWLEDNEIPVELRSNKQGLSLQIQGPFSFRVPQVRRSVELYSVYIETLFTTFHQEGFSAAEGRRALNLSESAMHRFLDWARDRERIERFGASTATKYYLPSRD